MELKRDNWQTTDIDKFKIYENTLKGEPFDCEWEQRIVNTKLECFARTSSKARLCFNDIKKGNYIEFLEKDKIKTHFDSILHAYLISNIKDFELFKKHLDNFVVTIDNWASADTLRFSKQDKDKLFCLSKLYLKSNMPFIRRVGLNIWFELIKFEKYFDCVFDILNGLEHETDYYVNMCGAWLLSFCMIRNKEKTLEYFKNNSTNKFVINKAISKCRDSYRVSREDKDKLLVFKTSNK